MKQDWLKPIFLPLAKVREWVLGNCPRFSLVPENASAKAIYALMHIARGGYNPPAIIWIFYGLESLFQRHVGENFSTLARRIALLLDLDASSAKLMKRELRRLYDARSAFVHGGGEVSHLVHDETMDRRIDEMIGNSISRIDFGVAVLLRCIQQLISEEIPVPRFAEKLHRD
jgi:hypothetical protein